jgi:hypothetical protein
MNLAIVMTGVFVTLFVLAGLGVAALINALWPETDGAQ